MCPWCEIERLRAELKSVIDVRDKILGLEGLTGEEKEACLNARLGIVIAICRVCKHVWYSAGDIGQECPYIGCGGTIEAVAPGETPVID